MTETEVLMNDIQKILMEVKDLLFNKKYNLDLTSKMLLKSESKEIEKYQKLVSKGKTKEKDIEQLHIIMVRLRTTIDGLKNFYE